MKVVRASDLWYCSEIVESRERRLLKVSRTSDLWYYSEKVERRERRNKDLRMIKLIIEGLKNFRTLVIYLKS